MSRNTYLVLFQFFNQSAFAGARFLVALYAVHQQASPFVIGLLVALFSMAPAFLTVPAGKLIDRIGTRIPLQLSLVIMFMVVFMLFFQTRMELLYLVAPVVGTAFFTVYVGASTLANHHSTPEERPANFSRISVGIAAAQGLAPLILGLCAEHLGYASAFAVAALFPLLCWGVFQLSGIDHLGPREHSGAQGKQGSTLALLRDPLMRPVFIISTLFIFAWDIFLVMSPIYGSQVGLSASQIGLLMSAFALASFMVRFLGASLSRLYTPWQLLLVALVVEAAGTIAFGLVTVLPLLLLASAVIGLGYGLCGPMTSTALYAVAPKERASEAMGLRLSLGMAAQSVVPLIVGSAGSFLPAGLIFVVTGLIVLMGAALQRRQWKGRPEGR